MTKRQFRIGDLAKELKVKKFVIRFWEKEFNLKSGRSQGGQRFYTSDDLNIFLTIKDLLYNQGFTIAGAKKQLPEVLAGARLADNDSFQEVILKQSMSIAQGSDHFDEDDNKQDDQEDDALALSQDEREFKCEETKMCELIEKIADTPQELSGPLELALEEIKVETEVKILSSQDAPTLQSLQEICVPVRTVSDSSFYEGLTTLKDQLMRLYELLD